MGTRKLWVLLVIGIIGFGCSGKDINDSDPKTLYEDAEADISSSNYQLAQDKLRILKNKFPYSKYSVIAKLRIADVFFLQENFAEAAASYETFRDLHPSHEKAAYAGYRTAKSYYLDIPSNIARDLTAAHRALDAYQDFLNKYPTSEFAEESRKDLVEVKSQLSQKELYIAKFYIREDKFEAAKVRLTKILQLYPDTPEAKTASEKILEVEKEIEKEAAKKKPKAS